MSPPVKRQCAGPAGDDFLGGGMSQPAQLAFFSQRQNSLTKTSQNSGGDNSQSSAGKSQEKLMSFGAFSQPAIVSHDSVTPLKGRD